MLEMSQAGMNLQSNWQQSQGMKAADRKENILPVFFKELQ